MRPLAVVVLLTLLAGCNDAHLSISRPEVNQSFRDLSPLFPDGEPGHAQATTRPGDLIITGTRYHGVLEVEQRVTTPNGQHVDAGALIGIDVVNGPELFRCGNIDCPYATDILRTKVNQWLAAQVARMRAKYPDRTITHGIGVLIGNDVLLSAGFD